MEGLNKETRCRGTRRQLEERVQWTLKGTGRLSAHSPRSHYERARKRERERERAREQERETRIGILKRMLGSVCVCVRMLFSVDYEGFTKGRVGMLPSKIYVLSHTNTHTHNHTQL